MISGSRSRLFVSFGILLTLIGVGMLAWTAFGHNYRHALKEQTATWYDGEKEYRLERSDQDTFDIALYREVRSVEEAVQYIRENYRPNTEEEKLEAVYDFTRKRFIHFMYPHHTWVTNPYLALAETVAPGKPFNEMALAEDKLRHSAVASCAHAANVFVEIYRAMKGEAQKVSFSGHDIVEARIDSQRYFVDPDLERFTKGAVRKVTQSESRLRMLYEGYPEERIDHYAGVFQTEARYWGYNGPSFNSPRIQKVQSLIERIKWVLPPLLVLIGGGLIVVGTRRV